MNTYAYAPIISRAIPKMLTTTAIRYGVDLAAAAAKGQRFETGNAGGPTFELERRIEADLKQAERGPLEAVTR